jgi:hypothetical protein
MINKDSALSMSSAVGGGVPPLPPPAPPPPPPVPPPPPLAEGESNERLPTKKGKDTLRFKVRGRVRVSGVPSAETLCRPRPPFNLERVLIALFCVMGVDIALSSSELASSESSK